MLQWHDPSGALSSARGVLQVAGSKTQSVGEPHSVTITNRLDAEVQRILRDGGSVLCLVDSQTTLPAGFPLTIIRRDTGGYDGNWASNLNWIRPANPAVGWIPSVPRLGFETSVTGLPLAIGNVPAQSFDDVLAGLFVGWVHNSAGYIVQMAAGNGVVVLCSITIARCVGDDPFAATLFARLVDYAAGSGVVPRLQWSIQ
jgi:hypothetical protein